MKILRHPQKPNDEELFSSLSSTVAFLRTCKLEILLFNLAPAHVVFFSKLMCMSACTVVGFIGVREASEGDYFVAGLMLVLFIIVASSFVGMYNFAYRIPIWVELVKDEILLQSQSLKNMLQRRELRMRMKAIPKLAIKSSQFHQIERESTPIFVDFVVEQTLGLLLTF